MFGFLFCLSVIASVSQVSAQYTGRVAESPVPKSNAGVNSPVSVSQRKSSTQNSLTNTSKDAGANFNKGERGKGMAELTKVFNANSANFKVFLSGGGTKTVPLVAPSQPRAVTLADYIKTLPPPEGAKKGHWMPAPPMSMSGMPTWVEDKN